MDTNELVYDRTSFKLASLKELNLSKFKHCYRTSHIRSKKENFTSLVRNSEAKRLLGDYPFRIVMKQGGILSRKKLQIAFSVELDQFYWCQALKNLIEIEKFNKASDIICDFFSPQSKDNELYESFSQKYAYYVTVVPTETSREFNFSGDFLMILKDTEIIFSKEYLRRPNYCIYLRHIRNFSINEKDILTLQTGTNSTFGRGEIKVAVKNLSIDKAYNDLISYVKHLKEEIEQHRKFSEKLPYSTMQEVSSSYQSQKEIFLDYQDNMVQLLTDSSKTEFSSNLECLDNNSSSVSSSTLLLSTDSEKSPGKKQDVFDKHGSEEGIYSVPCLMNEIINEDETLIHQCEEENKSKDEAETPF